MWQSCTHASTFNTSLWCKAIHTKISLKLCKRCIVQSFHKSISNLIFCWAQLHFNSTWNYMISKKMTIEFYMIFSFMKHWILYHWYNWFFATIDHCWAWWYKIQFFHNSSHPNSLLHWHNAEIYSTSKDDKVIVSYFFEVQDCAPNPTLKKNPLVSIVSSHDPP